MSITSGGLVTYLVKTNGNGILGTINVHSIMVDKGVNKISTAKLFILDGDPSAREFKVSSSNTFVPGNTISIEAGYDSNNKLLFEGIITKQRIKVDAIVGSMLEIECRDEAIKMAVGRKTSTYSKKKDSEIMQSIIGNYSKLSSDVSATPTVWPEQVQYYATDWDFILLRAEANGFIVTTLNGKVSVFPPNKETLPVLTVEYGDNLLEFNAELNSVNQIDSVQGSSWDYQTQKVVRSQAKSNYAGAGNLSTKKLSKVVDLGEYKVQTTAPLNTSDLSNWSQAVITKSEYAKIQGEVKFQGTSLVEPGKYIRLNGLGDRFNGGHLASSILHTISDGNWITEVAIGVSSNWFTQEPGVMATPASGLLPGAQGLFNGTVKKMYEDPDNQYRILIDVPMFDATGKGIWARLANFYSTSGAGAFFFPEVGDEVVIGFLNQDPRFPIILGSLYSSIKNKPYSNLTPNEKNSMKAIVSKKGLSMEFDDENVVLTFNTPNKNKAVFSDQDKKITIQDENGNSIEMNEAGITIKSSKDINIQASEKLILKGNTGVEIQSSGGDVTIEGMNVQVLADAEFSAKGSATAELVGGGETIIKGAMVMIN
ncbi:MAG: type VI secretion system tip protein VgrG [Flavobacteriaceae bacterium]|nr:type VI secretion system tip protein VgrG [Flavobacteriaceae bacterium]